MRIMGALDLVEVATPGTPGTARLMIYAKIDGHQYTKDDLGIERHACNDDRMVAITDGATITINVGTTDIATVTIVGNRALAFTGTPFDGQVVGLRVRQDATGSRTLTYPASVAWGTDVTVPTLSTAANKTDYLAWRYNAPSTTWDGLAVARGY